MQCRPIKRAQVKAGFIIELTFSTTFADEETPLRPFWLCAKLHYYRTKAILLDISLFHLWNFVLISVTFCYQNCCSDLLKKKLLQWSRKTFLSERSEQFWITAFLTFNLRSKFRKIQFQPLTKCWIEVCFTYFG